MLAPLCDRCDARAQGICAELRTGELAALAATRLSFAPGDTLMAQGDPAAAFFVIISGAVRLVATLPDGRRQIVSFVKSGDFLGLSAVDRHAVAAEALTPVLTCRMPRLAIEALLEMSSPLKRRLLREARAELERAGAQILLLGRKTARERLASFLLEYAHMPLPMGRQDIADYLGLTTETISRTLSTFARDGLIAINAHHDVHILKAQHLQKLASSTYASTSPSITAPGRAAGR